jgi:hypothetical protein
MAKPTPSPAAYGHVLRVTAQVFEKLKALQTKLQKSSAFKGRRVTVSDALEHALDGKGK